MCEGGKSKDYDAIALSYSSMTDDAQSHTTDLERAGSRSHLFCLFVPPTYVLSLLIAVAV
jgi:hypothetical protein